MNKVCLLAFAILSFSQLALGENEDDYTLVTCIEPKVVGLNHDPEVNQHCS